MRVSSKLKVNCVAQLLVTNSPTSLSTTLPSYQGKNLKSIIRKLIAACSLIVLIGLILNIFIDRPIRIHDTLDDISVTIVSNTSMTVLPDSSVEISWKVEDNAQVILNGELVENIGTLERALVQQYSFVVRLASGIETTYLVPIEAWITDIRRVSITLTTIMLLIIIFLVSGWKYLKLLQRWWQVQAKSVDVFSHTTNFVAEFTMYFREIVIVALATVIIHTILWCGWPPHRGTDTRSYISFYVNIFESPQIADFSLIYMRGLLPSFLHGWSLAQGLTIHILVQTLLAITASIMTYLIARPWGRFVAGIATGLFLLYLPLQLFFHQVGSEGTFTWCILLVALSLRYTLQSHKLSSAILFGVALGLAILTRPTGLLLFATILVIWLTTDSLSQKIRKTLVIVLAVCVIVIPWVAYRGINYGHWDLSRPQGTFFFTSAYSMRLIEANNGVASRNLAQIIETEILTYSSYQEAGILIDDVLQPDTNHLFVYYNDIIYYFDTYYGWDSRDEFFDKVGLEAIMTKPSAYFVQSVRFMYRVLLDLVIYIYIPDGNDIIVPFAADGVPRHSLYTAYPNDFSLPDEAVISQIRQREDELIENLYHSGDKTLAENILKIWQKIAPRLLPFYLFSLIALLSLVGKSQKYLVILFGTVMGLGIGSGMISPEIRYRMPIDSILIISAIIGFHTLTQACYSFLTQNLKKC